MYVKIRVTPKAKRESVEKIKDGYVIATKEPAKQGRANARVREMLACELEVPVKTVRLTSGHQSPHKIFSVHRN